MSRSSSGRTAAALFVLTLALRASGTVESETGYSKAQTYNGALRYLRVDLGYEVVEKDADAAYLLFRFVPSGRKANTNGSIEIVEQRDAVRIIVQLPELPKYHEQLLFDGLLRKLRTEYGDPPPHREEPPKKDKGEKPPEHPDGGTTS